MKIRYFIVLFVILFSTAGCSKKTSDKPADKTIFVSILPQKFFIEKIAGYDFDVHVMVGPGQSPHTYEPTPRQMQEMENSLAYFSIGVTFEKAWMDKIQKNYPAMKIIDTRKNIPLRNVESFATIFTESAIDDHSENLTEHDHHHDSEELDPHIWLSPELVMTQASTTANALAELNPSKQKLYYENLQNFHLELKKIHSDISETLSTLQSNKFMVFHPAWGYFADEFDLKQIPIEISGKSPSARELTKIIDFARKNNIRMIIVQKQISSRESEAIAKEIEGKVISLDPLSEDYLTNLRCIAEAISNE
ncbi:MAG: zinc ABC transporter substrate-binding protein [Candidatus Cloacimonetes bacterium]|nr:zinc ABC transporter substrate-binding protein [Candidatus Cloacimonadota bacterium]